MTARVSLMTVFLFLIVVLPEIAAAQSRSTIPSSALPGRERDRFIDQPYPPTPRIELKDGRPAPVFTVQDAQPVKRKKKRAPKRR
jgi:hypothetical protein